MSFQTHWLSRSARSPRARPPGAPSSRASSHEKPRARRERREPRTNKRQARSRVSMTLGGLPPSASCPTCGCIETSCAPCQTPAVCSNCASCCCSTAHRSWRRTRIRTGIMVEYLSSAWMVVEFTGSIATGLLAGSLALLAFGGDSMIELISGIAVLLHLRNDTRDPSTRESKSVERVTTALLFSLIPVIGLGAVYSFVSGLRSEGSPVGIVLAVAAVAIMPYLYFQKKRIGEQTRELSLQIDAIESVTCFLMSIALLGGLLLEFFLGLWWVDYAATGIILAFVAREAVESYHELRRE